ncbi:MAG: 2-oxoacid:acceptor oxidoreductase family protein, partial [Smithellaceae bacterium]|nr:2-oxoacid:acceptor oxidoreductase family protein [Smithellaceae bacterium]
GPSLAAFQSIVAPGGAIFLNSSIIVEVPRRNDVEVYKIPAVELADRLGNAKTANIVMMGALVKKLAIVPQEIFLQSIEAILGARKKSALEINRRAFSEGYDYS